MRLILSTIILFVICFSAAAQTAVIKGTVTSGLSNTVVQNVTVKVANTNEGTVTDSAGNYTLQLKPGNYSLLFTKVGFKSRTAYDIQVNSVKATVVDVALDEETATLDEVKVVASSRLTKTLESPLSLRSIGVSEIKRNPGGNRDISKVIQSLPGVSAPVSFRNDIIIRGGAPNENRFYLDGVEIPNINHFATQGSSGGPVGLINVDFVKEVNFYSGAFPANRGNALSSVFEFTQKNGRTDRMGATLSLGSSDLSATLEGPLGSKTTYLASYRYSYLQALFKLLKLPFLPTYQDFQFKVKTKLDSKNELTLIGLGAIDRFTLNKEANDEEDKQYFLATIPENTQNSYSIGAVLKHFTRYGFSQFVVSRSYLDNKANKFRNNNESEGLLLKYASTETENKFRFENTSQRGKYKVNFGTGAESAGYTTNTFNVLPYGNRIYQSDLNFFKYNFFGQVSRSFADNKLSLSIGARADANTYSNKMNNLLKTLSPRFSAAYNFTDRLSINFNTGIYYQLPAYTVMGYRDSTGTLLNKSLDYIQNRQVVLGLEYNTLKGTRFTVEGFYKQYRNYPIVRVLNDSIPLANLGADFGVVGNDPVVGESKGRSYGIEFFAQQRLNKGFYGIFALTLFKSEFQNKRGDYVASSWNNRYILSMTAGKLLKRNWEVGAKLRFTGGSPYTPYDQALSSLVSNYSTFPQGIPAYNLLNTQVPAAFYQLDARVDKKYYFKHYSFNFYFDMQNVTGHKYDQQPIVVPVKDASGNVQPVPGDPTRIQTKFLNRKGGNIQPTIGLIFEF
ncbi:TonB-dependent receptor [Mucilaginibacter terrenus]|uniref:TonB-dependent receptor n=1 Tax=Mucilaginibacter terrenus TaxID=2482727 RepID=A0A3E2NT89_9SPHI|nr:TonB-dependent receptor [Mucilaginibacter terrenus]RFZ84235.1 TonB-dependent receptor [Mucilaginibacter terrenus]